MMKEEKTGGLLQRYVRALRRHLRQGATASLSTALRLGHQAVALGLETLELARIHERALLLLKLPGSPKQMKLAERFFSEVMTPVVETHHAARQDRRDLKRVSETLRQRTVELSTANRQLKRGVVRRKSAEAALRKSGKNYRKCLEESLLLQKRLRHLTHRVLSAQEDERKSISRELQDEIAQTLLGIHVRLLSLKQDARSKSKGFRNEIVSTQRLVVQSTRSVQRAARKYGSL